MAEQANGRAAVLLPGGGYTTDGPLLMFAAVAAQRRESYVHRVRWSPRGQQEIHAWVVSEVEAALSESTAASGVDSPLVIGKSLGSLAASVAAERGLPAVWFTPVLTDKPTGRALKRATAPCLLVGGTADTLWDGTIARSVTSRVVEIEGADHGMFVPGDLAASAAVLGQVMTAVEQFLDDVVWR
jgi:pimeloyl-ACP methyl ester carboxylesterase